MSKKLLTIAAGAAMLIAGPALAQNRSNGQQNREQARQNSQGPANADQRGVRRSNENSVLHDGMDHSGHDMQDTRRQNSQGAANASDRARERANANSAVRQGMEVRDERGRRVGQVRDVRRAPDGTVIAIVVVLVVQINNTSVVTLPAGSFTIINNVVVVANINVNIGR
jgi:sporulation protein YlmC with PRC-barrel domain